MIIVMPYVFYAGYGLTIGNNPNVLSELHRAGAGLAATVMLVLFLVFPEVA